jgi:hypothetical protein
LEKISKFRGTSLTGGGSLKGGTGSILRRGSDQTGAGRLFEVMMQLFAEKKESQSWGRKTPARAICPYSPGLVSETVYSYAERSAGFSSQSSGAAMLNPTAPINI